MNTKRFVALLLAFCLVISNAYAEEENTSIFNTIGNWFNQAVEDTSNWASQAWSDVSAWAGQAWDDSSKWVSQAWEDSTVWASTNWDGFTIWMNTVVSGNPYSWIPNEILDNGLFAYDIFVDLRNFLADNPNREQLHKKFIDYLSELSLLNEDKDILWNTLQDWSDEKNLSSKQVIKIVLPYINRLQIEGSSAIGDDVILSGPVVAQYLLTILESMKLDSSTKADMQLKIQHSVLEGLTRPIIVGDIDQNILVTDDRYYIENFTYADGKYQIVLVVSEKKDDSKNSLEHIVEKYFEGANISNTANINLSEKYSGQSLNFSMLISEKPVGGKAIVIKSENYDYFLFLLTDQEWQEDEYDTWFSSIALSDSNSVSFNVDMASDGSFFGVNQGAQKYTINRYFDEARFQVPRTGHGWAAERGNNLIDNIKGIFKGQHSTIVGDNYVKNGADRVTTYADGSKLFIQTKYCSNASRTIQACFENNQFRYYDSEGKPMKIEVPADQYDDAVKLMKNRFKNGEIKGVANEEEAINIVKKCSLTYDQAKHIAKAGTVESILYDSAQACVTATTSMGISAAVNFAVNLWNGEPFETAIKESIFQGLKVGGTSFIISVLSSQIAKTGLNSAMIPASKVIVHALGPKVSAVIVNAFRPAGSAIYGAAAMQSAAKLLRGNVITSTVTFVVLSAGDVADIIQGRISWKQLAKNVSTTALGITGGTLGYLGGAALGTAIMPGAGTVVGIIISVAAGWGANEGAKALADLIAEDDANEMIHIIENQFSEIASEYFLNEEEVNRSIENLQNLITAEMLKQMYQYHNHEAFARQLIEMSIDPVVSEREYIELPSEEEYASYLTEVLEEIYDDLSDENE